MKKTILALAAVAMVSLTSCNKSEQKKDDVNQEATTETTNEEGTKESSAEVPNFESEKLEEYIKSYDSYMDDYKAAVESKDMTKFQELGTKGQELAEKAQALTTEGLSESDTQKLNEYMQAKSKEIQELSQQMMK